MDRRIELGSKTLGIPRNWEVKWDKFIVGTKMELRSKMVLRSARAVEYKMGTRSGRQVRRERQTRRQTDGERAWIRAVESCSEVTDSRGLGRKWNSGVKQIWTAELTWGVKLFGFPGIGK